MINEWLQLLYRAAETPAFILKGGCKVITDLSWEIPTEKLLNPGITYQDINYADNKRKQLDRNYWNQQEADRLIAKLQSRVTPKHTSVAMQLRGQSKQDSSQGFCMQNLVISATAKKSYVDIYYRSTELVHRFLADLIFFSEKLPQLLGSLQPEVVRFKFANSYLQAYNIPIIMMLDPNPEEFIRHLHEHDRRYARVVMRQAQKLSTDDTYNYASWARMQKFLKKVPQSKVKKVLKVVGDLYE